MKSPAVFFDLGDVLVKLRFERGLRRFAEAAGCDRALAADATSVYMGETAHRYYAGDIEPRAFFEGLRTALGCGELAVEACIEAWCDIFDPWPEMEALAGAVIDAGHPTYLLSNTEPIHYELLRGRMPVLGRFTDLHLSYEVRLAKPDPRYWLSALERFGLAAEGCLFVDDRLENVEAARALGIRSCPQRGDVDEVRRFLRENGVEV